MLNEGKLAILPQEHANRQSGIRASQFSVSRCLQGGYSLKVTDKATTPNEYARPFCVTELCAILLCAILLCADLLLHNCSFGV